MVSQPEPLSAGKTVVTPDVTVNVKEEKTKSVVVAKGATVEELVRALQAVGSTQRDIIAICKISAWQGLSILKSLRCNQRGVAMSLS